MRRQLLLALCLALCSLVVACAPIIYCDLESVEGGCRGPIFVNPRIEIVQPPSAQATPYPSKTFWLSAGESLVARWDGYVVEAHLGDELCDFSNLTEATDDCELCDFCQTEQERQPLCPGGRPKGIPDVKITSFAGFLTSEVPSSAFPVNFATGCSADGLVPATFIPEQNATYQLQHIGKRNGVDQEYSFLEKKIFVVHDDIPQTTSYELQYYVSEPTPSPTPTATPTPWPKVWYRWTIGASEIWEDSFSDNLRIAEIRVTTGTRGTNPITGRFQLQGARPVRPSRIVLQTIPMESEPWNPIDILGDDGMRCYADEFTLDGAIDLRKCRIDFGVPTPTGTPPIYTATPNIYDGKRLIWFVEFNEAEKADFDPRTTEFDPVPPNAILAIEFVIEKYR